MESRFLEEKISPKADELRCAMQASSSCRGTGGGAADSQVESAESSSSTMKTKAEGVLRVGPDGRQVHIVKDQKAIGTLKAKSRVHTGSAGLQKVLAVN